MIFRKKESSDWRQSNNHNSELNNKYVYYTLPNHIAVSPELAEQIGQWLRFMHITKAHSNHTIRSYRADMMQFLQFLEAKFSDHNINFTIDLKLLAKLKVSDFRSWIADRHNLEYSNSSTARAISVIKNFISYLGKQKITIATKNNQPEYFTNPAIKLIRSPKKNEQLPRALSVKQCEDILSSLTGELENGNIAPSKKHDDSWIYKRDIAIVMLMYGSGMRVGEVLSLTPDHIPSKAGHGMNVVGKGKKQRYIALLPIVHGAVLDYMDSLPYNINNQDALFRSKTGKILLQPTVSAIIANLRGILGLPENATAHSMRHSFASHILANGANLRTIQDLLGHENLSTTQRYTKIDQTQMVAAVKLGFD